MMIPRSKKMMLMKSVNSVEVTEDVLEDVESIDKEVSLFGFEDESI